jgi:hypothetical protein
MASARWGRFLAVAAVAAVAAAAALVTLAAGRARDVRIDYHEKTGATMKLLRSGPGTAKQVVPSARLLTS